MASEKRNLNEEIKDVAGGIIVMKQEPDGKYVYCVTIKNSQGVLEDLSFDKLEAAVAADRRFYPNHINEDGEPIIWEVVQTGLKLRGDLMKQFGAKS